MLHSGFLKSTLCLSQCQAAPIASPPSQDLQSLPQSFFARPATRGYRRRFLSNETLFGEPGRFYVYVSFGIHHCVNVVTHKADWANGVLLRAVAIPVKPERLAAGPALLARCFGIDRSRDAQQVHPDQGLWIAPRPPELAALAAADLVQTSRIGISQGQDIPWRWY